MKDAIKQTTDDPSSERSETVPAAAVPRAKGKVRRRGLLQGFGGIAGAAVVFGSARTAQASNSWGTANVSDEKLVNMYTLMLRSRHWEGAMKDAFLTPADGLYGACHLYIGEEAVAVGAISAINADDYIASTHRGHGHLHAKGGDMGKMAAEMFFRTTGYNQGFGGSMHLTDVSRGILGMNGIVGPSHLIAAGAAYGIKVRGTKQVAMSFGGDGSVNNGWFFAALRNASLYSLPLVVVIENNGYQISMPTERTNALKELATLAKGMEIPGETVDGNDVLAVYAVAQRAVERARAGLGPSVIEAKTYRWYDHAGMAGAKIGQDGAFGLPYRTDREVRYWMSRDPIVKMRTFLLSEKILTDEGADKIIADVKADVAKAMDFARTSPHPDGELGLKHVYAEGSVRASQFLA
jgi:TPP-dependent pyruvate/acetoin dehydrogenase alpha subunit